MKMLRYMGEIEQIFGNWIIRGGLWVARGATGAIGAARVTRERTCYGRIGSDLILASGRLVEVRSIGRLYSRVGMLEIESNDWTSGLGRTELGIIRNCRELMGISGSGFSVESLSQSLCQN
jgi:hypothetical protein